MSFAAGDEVYVVTHSDISRATVTRTTSTLAIVEVHPGVEVKYKQSDGSRTPHSGGYSNPRIAHLTPLLDLRYQKSRLQAAARKLSSAALELSQDKPGSAELVDQCHAAVKSLQAQITDTEGQLNA